MVDSALTRPGGRTARVRRQVLHAAEDLLIARGLAGLDVTALAIRAQVGRATIHRRWGGLPGVLSDLLTQMAETSLPRADTGTIRGDLLANAGLVRKTLGDPRQGRLFRALIGAAGDDAVLGAALAGFYRTRIGEWVPCVSAAVDRGELPPGTSGPDLIRAVSAPLYHRWLTGVGALTPAVTRQAVDAALAAARAGVFVAG